MHWGHRFAVLGGAGMLVLTPALASATITYRILNHPDGGAIGTSVDADGYAFRLDESTSGPINTFNANHTELFFSWEPGGTTAKIFGQVTHNESGTDPNNFDANDDVWNVGLSMNLDSSFRNILLTDGEEPPWYGGNSTDRTFDDMLAALLADKNFPDSSNEKSSKFDTGVARIYFNLADFTLTPVSGAAKYQGNRAWSEFPNDPSKKRFFIQYRWRLWKSKFTDPAFDVLGAAGWLESPSGSGYPEGCCQDLFFTFGDRVVPEPASATLLVTALALLGITRRRRGVGR